MAEADRKVRTREGVVDMARRISNFETSAQNELSRLGGRSCGQSIQFQAFGR
jgi:hypothetical protein